MTKKLKFYTLSIFLFIQQTVFANSSDSHKPIEVLCEKIDKTEFYEELSIIGTCKNERNIEYISECNGKITYISPKEGKKISKGEIILKIDEEIAESMIKEAHLKFEHASFSFLSEKNLFENEMISYNKYKISEMQFEREKNEYEKSLLKYNNMIIKAPYNGTLGILSKRIGNIVKQGDKLFDFVDANNFMILAEVSDAMLHSFSNSAVEIFIIDNKGKRIRCKLEAVSPNISLKGTITLKISLPYSDFFVDGKLIEIIIIYNKHIAPSISEKAIIREDDGEFIYEIVDGICKKLNIKTGLRINGKIELLDFDFNKHKNIVIEGFTKISDGTIVKETVV